MLPRLDAAIEREIVRLRGRYQLSLDEFRGLYVSDEQVDALLRSVGFDARMGFSLPLVTVPGRWSKLIADFALEPIEADLLLLVLASELDTRYPTLFAYLNDEASARQPTVDLAMRLFGSDWDQRERIRLRLQPSAPLRKSGLVVPAPNPPTHAQTGLSIAPLAACHLLGGDAADAIGLKCIDATEAEDTEDVTAADMARWLAQSQGAPTIVLAGRVGTGRRRYAAHVAALIGKPLALLPAGRIARRAEDLEDAILAARLSGSMLLLAGDGLAPEAHAANIAEAPLPIFVMVREPGAWERALSTSPNITRQFEIPPIERRRSVWRGALRSEGLQATPKAIDAVAGRFRLSAGAVRHAARDARIAQLQPCGERRAVHVDALMEAARRQCTLDLGHLASRVDARPGWDDLVLPGGVLQQLRDFAGASAERDRVYASWGMGSVGRACGRGVAALFSGASGTGKTMSAAVIARATGLDLWRIDLSSVVSKYIGETEKNLEKIFSGARDGDAILLFDEADALFGKRSEVRDAHDRYANVEVAYLLQRLEEHDGIAILASNFSRNIDLAFIRRLHYIVEFPLPDVRLRERLWRKAFARETPLGDGIDYVFLARQFSLAGGDIRSAALDAAFLAANDGGVVTMPHILRAVSRQMLKQGRLPSRNESTGWNDSHHPVGEAAE